jgi:UDP-N-acetylglucosamine--N-acetylmuramyl-(pentapeptide) pyrophosphoryl-undecaprenol N-acetylglucosamine transferase
MEKFFPAESIKFTGNPVRQNLLGTSLTREEAAEKMGLNKNAKTILIVGGSLGARTINESVLSQLETIRQQEDVQFVWQTGKFYANEIAEKLKEVGKPDNLHVMDFISDMAVAYAAADLVVSRAGAGSISEFCLLGKPVILVPSPNVAEDHQTKNAMALVHKSAALYVPDAEAGQTLITESINTVKNGKKLQALAQNIKTLARPNAARDIAEEVIRLARENK